MAATLSVYNMQLRNIAGAKRIVCPTNHTVDGATALLAHDVPAPLTIIIISRDRTDESLNWRSLSGIIGSVVTK